MTTSSSAIKETALAPKYARMVTFLRWACVVPSFLITLILTFFAMWFGVGSLVGLADDGASWFSICIVLVASFAAVSASALIAPKYKLVIALLGALLTVCLVPYPYTSQSSGDGEAIPSSHEVVGVVLGSFLAIALVFYCTWRTRKYPSS